MPNGERDKRIIELLYLRDESALGMIDAAYGKLCANIAGSLLSDRRDVEEVLNDVLLAVWKAVPPANPDSLSAFVCRIARRTAISRHRHNTRQKRDQRGDVLLSEVEEFLPDTQDDEHLRELLSEFLRSENELSRKLFICRYVLFDDITVLAERFSLTENAVAVRLTRTKSRLKEYLKKEGYFK